MTKLYVGNLSFGMTDEGLQQLFVAKDIVASARVITDRETGRSRGFGFVELGAADDATKAIGEFNGMDLEGAHSSKRSASSGIAWRRGSFRRPRLLRWTLWRRRRPAALLTAGELHGDFL